jgi:hypothetical protein
MMAQPAKPVSYYDLDEDEEEEASSCDPSTTSAHNL